MQRAQRLHGTVHAANGSAHSVVRGFSGKKRVAHRTDVMERLRHVQTRLQCAATLPASSWRVGRSGDLAARLLLKLKLAQQAEVGVKARR